MVQYQPLMLNVSPGDSLDIEIHPSEKDTNVQSMSCRLFGAQLCIPWYPHSLQRRTLYKFLHDPHTPMQDAGNGVALLWLCCSILMCLHSSSSQALHLPCYRPHIQETQEQRRLCDSQGLMASLHIWLHGR